MSDIETTGPNAGALRVSAPVRDVLYALAGEIDNTADEIRAGKGDPIASLEDLASQFRLLASGTWGAGTYPTEADLLPSDEEMGEDAAEIRRNFRETQ